MEFIIVDSEIGRLPTSSSAPQGVCQTWLTVCCPFTAPRELLGITQPTLIYSSYFPGPQEQHPFRCVKVTGFLVNYCVCTFLNMLASSRVLQGKEVFFFPPIHTPKRLAPLFLQSVSLCPKWRKEKRCVSLRRDRRISPGLRAGSGCMGLSQCIFIFVKLAFSCFPVFPR